MNRVRRSFTLVELLIVISIIAILAALLLPALSEAKNKAKVVLCLTNVRTIAQAFSLYASDHGRRFPQIGIGNSEATGADNALRDWHVGAADKLLNYAGGAHQVFGCPTLPTLSEATWTLGDTANPGIFRRVNYLGTTSVYLDPVAANSSMHTTADLNGDGAEDNLRPLRMTERPELVLVGDMLLVQAGSGFLMRHQKIDGMPKGGNFAYVDGHANWVRFENTAPKFSYLGTLGDRDRDYYW